MISCTEFIPAYSELFTFLENEYGRAEVDKFWTYLFEPDGKGIPLVNFVKKEGIRGCFSYWSGSLNEEAADFDMYLNEKAGWFMIDMHHCPSKGRLLKLEKEIGIVPYHDYCLHCDHYRQAVKSVGLEYHYDFRNTDHAACTNMIYDPKVFDGRFIMDENTVVMHRTAGDNEYFHRDFHSSMNMGVAYLGENYGVSCVKKYLTQYTHHVYKKLIDEIHEKGLAAIADKIRDTYEAEKASDDLTLTLENGKLSVRVRACPAVSHLKNTGRTVSRFYRYTTETVMECLAAEAGARFCMEDYDEATGRAAYTFTK